MINIIKYAINPKYHQQENNNTNWFSTIYITINVLF